VNCHAWYVGAVIPQRSRFINGRRDPGASAREWRTAREALDQHLKATGKTRRLAPEAWGLHRHQNAVGLVVKDMHEYPRAVALSELNCPPPVPQSFAYLPSSTLDEIECLQPIGDLIPTLNLRRLRQVPGRLLASVASR
jgi:hypothetical protein